ncbi:hypothetical protein NP493_1610g01023 [Ridgeia piscesae]|uniref:SEA domain-containing protein n=1 Tax=Ridgeia piscesae TaxID=27915 RepID=A0AAD9NB93_RIDPI|nr:hypothetical protein NP493_1610g01023 [Ridgeia piscesae]
MAIACVLLDITTPPLIPFADQARVKVNIKLTIRQFTKDLEDETSETYKNLKTEVVQTLKEVLTRNLGEGKFEIIKVTFSEGSVVVNYELAVNKAAATKTLETIVDTVKEATKNGSFGNFAIDPESVKVESESYNIKYACLGSLPR